MGELELVIDLKSDLSKYEQSVLSGKLQYKEENNILEAGEVMYQLFLTVQQTYNG